MTKKEIEAAIKPEFMAKLKQLRVKTKFMNNIMDPKWDAEHKTNERLDLCLNTKTWGILIGFAFNWKKTKEGYNFWDSIYSK